MNAWIKVLTHPLGLAGFALFLVFTLVAKAKQRSERRWLSPAAVLIALVALLGGLSLDYRQLSIDTQSTPKVGTSPAQASAPLQQPVLVDQHTTGPGSPAVNGVTGDVTITVDQSGTDAKDKKKTASSQPSSKH